jgi:hypothetical protein
MLLETCYDIITKKEISNFEQTPMKFIINGKEFKRNSLSSTQRFFHELKSIKGVTDTCEYDQDIILLLHDS